MKIIQVNTLDNVGGAARAAYRLHRGLIEIGQNSRMVVRDKLSVDSTVTAVHSFNNKKDWYSNYLKLVQDQYINANRTQLSNTLFSLPYPGYDISTLQDVVEADVINLHWVAHYQSPATIRALASLKKPLVWTLHDMWAFTGGCHYGAGCDRYQAECRNCPQLSEDPYHLPAAILRDKKTAWADINLTVVTPSQWLAECAKKSNLFSECRVEVIPYSLETNIFRPHVKAKAKAQFGLDPDVFALLIGADDGKERRKGFDELRQALQICLEDEDFYALSQRNKVQLLCFGLPNERLETLQLPVIALGRIASDEALSQIYSAADLFILPSLEDNLPNTMLESMSCGTPVVGFNIGGVPDMVKPDVTGWLVPFQNSAKMASAILDCLNSPQKRKAMAKACRQIMEKDHALPIQAQRYTDLYKGLKQQTSLTGLLQSQRSAEATKLDAVTSSVSAQTELLVPLDTSSSAEAGVTFERIFLRLTVSELDSLRSEVAQVNRKNDDLQHSVTELQTELAANQVCLQETKKKLQNSEMKLQSSEILAQRLQSEVDAARAKSSRLEVKFRAKQTHLQKVKKQLRNSEIFTQQLQDELTEMKNSKFWKIRALWLKFKSTISSSQQL